MDLLQLALSLGIVTLGAELLVRGSSALALRAGLSPLFVGLTVVGFGTSTPELGASVAATLHGSTQMSVGNCVGSNLFNVGVILGLTSLCVPIRVQLAAVRRDLLVALAVAPVPLASLLFGGVLPRALGPVLVTLLVVYLASAYRAARRAPAEEEDVARHELEETLHPRRRPTLAPELVRILAGLAGLAFGSRLFVLSALSIARRLGVSELVIGLTVVSAGTSLPELVTSLVATLRRSPDLALGNVLGSNVFNLLGILGVATTLGPQDVPPSVVRLDVPVLGLGTLALLPILKTGGRISRLEGALLLLGYGLYLFVLLGRGG